VGIQASARVFQRLDNTVYQMLQSWALYRHPNKPKHWIVRKYWRVDEGQGWVFQPTNSDKRLARHDHTPIQRHVKVKANAVRMTVTGYTGVDA
jgi:RNA-directed DNA polymerase